MASTSFELRTAFDSWTIEVRRHTGRRTPTAVAREFTADLRFHLETGSFGAVQLIVQLLSAVASAPAAGLAQPGRDPLPAHLLAEVERELSHGSLVVTKRARNFAATTPVRPPPAPASPPAPKETSETFFDVRYVDETGQPVNGIPVRISSGGADHEVKTNAGGVALLENQKSSAATAVLDDAQAVEKVLDKRWVEFRLQKAPKVSNMFTFPFKLRGMPSVPLKAAVPHTVVLTPPLGKLFVELLDKSGRVHHAGKSYTIEGPTKFQGTTSDKGLLLHEDVFPGDYTLKLTLEFFEGKAKQTDILESPLVVLDRSSPAQVRELGIVPISILARIRLLFNTNKAFLLPTALPALRKLRDLYIENHPSKLLAVGHADTTGEASYNDRLSLDRAKATIAYLKDDVDAWLAMYGTGVPQSQRWGRVEDRLMLIAMDGFRGKPRKEEPVRWYQRTRKLKVDGSIGPNTRKKLVEEYMALDGASLADEGFDILATAHGCGENFPLDASGEKIDEAPKDEKRDPLDRRVELFFFDTEFGIQPPPPGDNSKAASAEYPAWRKGVVREHELQVEQGEGPGVTFVEMADTLFRTNSSVVLPEGEAPAGADEDDVPLTAANAIGTALRFVDEHPGKRVFIAGHTDTQGSDDFNQKLSDERGKMVLALLTGGDEGRESFKTLCDGRHTVSDYKQILAWVSQTFADMEFDCDPGEIDDDAARGEDAVESFQRGYNRNKKKLGATAPDLTPDGKVGKLTWGAFFDCYEAGLRLALGVDAAGVEKLRGQVVFVDDERKSLGFGECYPIEELGVDDFESQTNRRAEILFFDIGEEPDLEHAEKEPETTELYLPGFYRRKPIDLSRSDPRRMTLRLFLHDEVQQLMRLTPYELQIGDQVRSNSTDPDGLLVQENLPFAKTCELKWKQQPAFYPLRAGDDILRFLEAQDEKVFVFKRTIRLVPHSRAPRVVATMRLANLGYVDESFDANWGEFQRAYGLKQTRFPDSKTFERLREVHGDGLEPGPKETAPQGKDDGPELFEDDGKFASALEIVLNDAEGNPAGGERFEVLDDASKAVASGTLDENGFALILDLPPGTLKVSFPDLHEDAWQSTEA